MAKPVKTTEPTPKDDLVKEPERDTLAGIEGGDIDSRMAALLEEHVAMGVREPEKAE